MPPTTPSRRAMLAPAAVLAATALAPPATPTAATMSANERTVRRYYKLWETPDWAPMDAVLAPDFTFTSAAGDDHISKAAFKRDCWDTQINFTRGFDLEVVMARGDAVLVKYLGHTKTGKTFRNIEYLRLRGGRIISIECYFGGKATFPSAVEAARN